MGHANAATTANVQFGSTDYADTVPSHLSPSSGPFYLEGRLVLSLSFQSAPTGQDLLRNDGTALESYRLWDERNETWHESALAVQRFEHADVVMRLEPEPVAIWSGQLDTHARVIPVPDLDAEGLRANEPLDLCWKRC